MDQASSKAAPSPDGKRAHWDIPQNLKNNQTHHQSPITSITWPKGPIQIFLKTFKINHIVVVIVSVVIIILIIVIINAAAYLAIGQSVTQTFRFSHRFASTQVVKDMTNCQHFEIFPIFSSSLTNFFLQKCIFNPNFFLSFLFFLLNLSLRKMLCGLKLFAPKLIRNGIYQSFASSFYKDDITFLKQVLSGQPCITIYSKPDLNKQLWFTFGGAWRGGGVSVVSTKYSNNSKGWDRVIYYPTVEGQERSAEL